MIDSIGSSATNISNLIIQRAGEEAQKNVVPSQTDPTLATPETVNTVANGVQDAANNRQVEQEAQQTATRTAALSINQAQQQQENVENYIENSTDQEIDDDNDVNLSEAADLYQQQKRSNSLQSISYFQEQTTGLGENRDAQNGLQRSIEESITPRDNVFTIAV